jgi:tetratricopeptide (TPR) repeat protein
MLEMMRVLENRLVYLQNFSADPTAENRALAALVVRFVDDVTASDGGGAVLTTLEAIYYRAVASLCAGDHASARRGFTAACESEESDEANDIKYKSFVILGHLSHADADYLGARELHERSLKYSANGNVTAQALALKALNSYALGEHDEALNLFREALALFRPREPFFNSYFFRNALLFCGAIHFDRGELEEAESSYRRVVESADPGSFDSFDALSHLGRIEYARRRWDAAAGSFENALKTHRVSENELVVDTWFWLARCHLRRNDPSAARGYLEKIAATDVPYQRKPQAAELLAQIP